MTYNDWFLAELRRLLLALSAEEGTPASRTAEFGPDFVEILRKVLSSGEGPKPDALRPGSRFAGFEIRRELGSGGQGDLCIARQEWPDRDVALKVGRADPALARSSDHWRRHLELVSGLRQGVDRNSDTTPEPRGNRRRRRRGRLPIRLPRAELPSIYTAGIEGGRSWVALELIRGRSLHEIIESPTQHPETAEERSERRRSVVLLMVRVARCIHRIHGVGSFHRDIKPRNIMVQDDRAGDAPEFDGTPYVVDLDLVMRADESGLLAGTTPYMAPELFAHGGAVYSAASEVFALGLTLYDALVQELPKDDRKRDLTVVDLGLLAKRGADPSLIGVVARAISPNRDARPASAEDFASELEAWLDDRPLPKRPCSVRRKLRLWARRHREPLVRIGAGLAAVMLVVFATRSSVRGLGAVRRFDAAAIAGDLPRAVEEAAQVPWWLSFLLDGSPASDSYRALEDPEVARWIGEIVAYERRGDPESRFRRASEAVAALGVTRAAQIIRSWSLELSDPNRGSATGSRGHTAWMEAIRFASSLSDVDRVASPLEFWFGRSARTVLARSPRDALTDEKAASLLAAVGVASDLPRLVAIGAASTEKADLAEYRVRARALEAAALVMRRSAAVQQLRISDWDAAREELVLAFRSHEKHCLEGGGTPYFGYRSGLARLCEDWVTAERLGGLPEPSRGFLTESEGAEVVSAIAAGADEHAAPLRGLKLNLLAAARDPRIVAMLKVPEQRLAFGGQGRLGTLTYYFCGLAGIAIDAEEFATLPNSARTMLKEGHDAGRLYYPARSGEFGVAPELTELVTARGSDSPAAGFVAFNPPVPTLGGFAEGIELRGARHQQGDSDAYFVELLPGGRSEVVIKCRLRKDKASGGTDVAGEFRIEIDAQTTARRLMPEEGSCAVLIHVDDQVEGMRVEITSASGNRYATGFPAPTLHQPGEHRITIRLAPDSTTSCRIHEVRLQPEKR